jgi:hypothetical protein
MGLWVFKRHFSTIFQLYIDLWATFPGANMVQGRNTLGYLRTRTFYTPERKYAYKYSQICRTFWEEYVRPESMSVDTLGVYCILFQVFVLYWSGSSSRQLYHLARALTNFRLIFSPSLKDAVPILRINFYRISLWNIVKIPTAPHILS